MELRLSVGTPSAARTDLLIDVDPASPVRDLAGLIGATVGGTSGRAQAWRLYLDGVEIDPGIPLHQSPIRDGAQLSLGGPAQCRPADAQGTVEEAATAGPTAAIKPAIAARERLSFAGVALSDCAGDDIDTGTASRCAFVTAISKNATSSSTIEASATSMNRRSLSGTSGFSFCHA